MSQANTSLVLRPLRGREDAEAIYAVLSGSAETDQLDPYSTLESDDTLDRLRQHLDLQDPALYCVAHIGG